MAYSHCLVCSAFLTLAQTIFVPNNNPGAVTGVNVFTGNSAVADAITAAWDGDIIYVVCSRSSYNAIAVSKSLTIYGAGFNRDKTNSVTSKVGNISVSANNVRLSGLVTPFVQAVGSVTATMIEKCRVDRISVLIYVSLRQ